MNDIILAAASETGKMTVGDHAITAIFGYIVVFIGLAILMAVIQGVGAIFVAKDKKAKAAAEAAKASAPAKTEAPKTAEPKLAPGSAGRIKLYDVPDKEAAMIMAIVADKMQKPLNELHFISIKEVK